jgi:aerobic-type carbon monoxide dehydrogenase small subunit (CoxS/CutS family)
MSRIVTLMVNGAELAVDVPPEQTLLGVLRDELGLTGCKIGCGEGACGACTVLIDGQPVRSCITPVGAAVGRQVLTVEGLEQHGRLHPLQQAFLDVDALQCGYCTPGMIMTGLGLLSQCPNPTEDEIIRAMDGNICRCGAYPRIVRAVERAAEELYTDMRPEVKDE